MPAVGTVGSTFTIEGAGFTGTTSVTVGGVSATFSADSDTSISATVPSGAASGFVAVTNPAGTATSTAPFLVVPSGSFAHVFTVNSTGDGADASPGDGSCDDGSGNCTLRAAIQEANAASGSDLIAFAIAASGVQTIKPATALPAITDPVTIDATTEPGFTSGHPLVEVNGGSTPGAVDGLAITAGGTTVRGLIVDAFHGWAVHLSGAGGDTIAGNFIGTTPDGTALGGTSGQASDGIFVDGVGSNTIGGTSGTTPGTACAGDCNLISPGYLQAGHGVAVQVTGPGATGNVIEGNFIGTNRTGQALPSSGAVNGVSLSGAADTTIGGTSAAARNLLGNIAFYGVLIHQSPNTTVEGDWLGIDASGSSAVPITQQTVNDDGTSSGVVHRRAHVDARQRARQRDRRQPQRGAPRRRSRHARGGEPDRPERRRHGRGRQPVRDQRRRRGHGGRQRPARAQRHLRQPGRRRLRRRRGRDDPGQLRRHERGRHGGGAELGRDRGRQPVLRRRRRRHRLRQRRLRAGAPGRARTSPPPTASCSWAAARTRRSPAT